MIDGCPICQGAEFLDIHRRTLPIARWIPAGERPDENDFAELEIVGCAGCGHVFNRRYDEALAEKMYRDVLLTNIPVNVSMMDSLEDVARWIGVANYGGGRVVEIGCGGGHLARIFARDAEHVTVFEPSRGLRPESLPEANITLVNAEFRKSDVHAAADLVVCRQVLEHLADPLRAMRDIRAIMAPAGAAYLEVPDAAFVAEHASVWDLYLGHVQYFGRANLVRLAEQAGLRVERIVDLKAGHDFGVLLRRDGAPSEMPAADPGKLAVGDLGGRLRTVVERSRAALERCNGPVALYGSTSHGQVFLNTCSDIRPFEAVFDDNEDYRGFALFSRDQVVPVMPPTEVRLADINTIVITAFLHDLGIASKLRRSGFEGRILTIRTRGLPNNDDGLSRMCDAS